MRKKVARRRRICEREGLSIVMHEERRPAPLCEMDRKEKVKKVKAEGKEWWTPAGRAVLKSKGNGQ